MNKLLQRNVYLIGMMGSGKSTVGEILARKLNYRFVDTDVLIESVAKKTIPEIFGKKRKGEKSFRKLETQVLKEVPAYNRAIATGGGVIRKRNWIYLRQGLTIWLDVDVEILKERLSGDRDRPLAGKLKSLIKKRHEWYSKADIHNHYVAGQKPQEVADCIMEQISQYDRE